jgi:hypothetical protein
MRSRTTSLIIAVAVATIVANEFKDRVSSWLSAKIAALVGPTAKSTAERLTLRLADYFAQNPTIVMVLVIIVGVVAILGDQWWERWLFLRRVSVDLNGFPVWCAIGSDHYIVVSDILLENHQPERAVTLGLRMVSLETLPEYNYSKERIVLAKQGVQITENDVGVYKEAVRGEALGPMVRLEPGDTKSGYAAFHVWSGKDKPPERRINPLRIEVYDHTSKRVLKSVEPYALLDGF